MEWRESRRQDVRERDSADSAIQQVRDYHQRTKHSLQAYAKGPEALDWSAQPNSFRVFEGSPITVLPLVKLPETLLFSDLIAQKNPANTFHAKSLSSLLRLSFGLAQWKQFGTDQWALRCNPSSGNLHPTEAYVLLVGWDGFKNGVYHYDSYLHALALRCEFLDQAAFEPLLLVGFSTVHWREAWKYGERAFRYCHLDIGHVLGSLGISAASLGWQIALLADGADERLSHLLGTGRSEFQSVEAECAECLLAVGPSSTLAEAENVWEILVHTAASGCWMGAPNLLDPKPLYRWPVIDEVNAASKLVSAKNLVALSAFSNFKSKHDAVNIDFSCSKLSAEQVILRRRSAQAYAPEFVLSQADFWQLMNCLSDDVNWPGPAAHNIHVVIAVHKVEGVTPGFYLLNREGSNCAKKSFGGLKDSLGRWTDWVEISHQPAIYSLHRMTTANVQRAVGTLDCNQRIATDGAIEIGFLAEFDDALEQFGAAAYRHLHWQAGLLGHRLYLQATALELAGTGIGCFFDDAWHELLGITDTRFQFVYHFAIGQPLHDSRLISLSGYFHLQDRPWESL